jgi:hypothetical protein
LIGGGAGGREAIIRPGGAFGMGGHLDRAPSVEHLTTNPSGRCGTRTSKWK